ncbi:hypothetical protein [Streptomyces canus]|uniref:Uncharacterized protein n=1 Tax=Streptomyces canus TaxID=58343 RepID=A0AAW8FU62_9ACTN|nr:hypothetical protein [Streptomyces canus]MDQ0757862.1 hypothetical protein [Streptomyces canus]MDQ0913389.1 hypothetical protein [Streptomyces canus]
MTGPCVASGRPAGNSSAPTAATTAAMTAQAVKALPKPPVPAAVPAPPCRAAAFQAGSGDGRDHGDAERRARATAERQAGLTRP